MNKEEQLKGIFISGVVMGRTKRLIGDKKIEVVTYRINDDKNDHMVDEWNPDDYFAIGSEVCLPIYFKSYQSKNGKIYTNIIVQNGKMLMNGEEF